MEACLVKDVAEEDVEKGRLPDFGSLQRDGVVYHLNIAGH